jgi:hypothetical protein
VFTKAVVEPNGIYSREETARLLGISLTTLKQLIKSGQLVVSQPVGIRRVFIKGSNILEMLDRTSLPNKVALSAGSQHSDHNYRAPNTTTPRKIVHPDISARLDNSVPSALREQPALPVRHRAPASSKHSAPSKGGAIR